MSLPSEHNLLLLKGNCTFHEGDKAGHSNRFKNHNGMTFTCIHIRLLTQVLQVAIHVSR